MTAEPRLLPAGGREEVLPVVGIVVVMIGALASVAMGSILPVAAAVGLVVVAVSAASPRFAAIICLFLWGGPFATQAAGRRVGGASVDIADLLVVVALAGYAYRCWQQRRPLMSRLHGLFIAPIALYLLVVLMGLVRGLAAGNARGTALDAFLAMSALSIYVLLRVAYAHRLRTFVTDVVVVAAVGSALLIVAAVFGFAPQLGVVVDSFYTRGAQDTSLRIDAPVQRLAIIAIFLVTVGTVPYKNPSRWHRALLLAPLIAGLGVSLTRSTWLPVLAVAIALPALVHSGIKMPLTLARRGVVSVLVLAVTLAVASTGVLGGYVRSAAIRFLSAGDQDVLLDDSFQQRLVENGKAALRISQEPLWGIGFPRSYGAFIPYWPEGLNVQVFVPRDFIHNSYLGLAMFFGLPGVFALLVLVGAFLVVLRGTATAAPSQRPIPLASLGAAVVFAVTSSFQTQLGYEPFYVVLATIFALIDVWRAEEHDLRSGRMNVRRLRTSPPRGPGLLAPAGW